MNKNIQTSPQHTPSMEMRCWLVENKNPYFVGVSNELAAEFNRHFRKLYPKLYEVAKEHVQSSSRYSRRYSSTVVYTYIEYKEINDYPMPLTDPYPKAPSSAALLADTAILLAREYPNICNLPQGNKHRKGSSNEQ